jgi:hypothetical protein
MSTRRWWRRVNTIDTRLASNQSCTRKLGFDAGLVLVDSFLVLVECAMVNSADLPHASIADTYPHPIGSFGTPS